MSKTYQLPVKAMAQRISGTVYDKTANVYNMTYHQPVYLEFTNIPNSMTDLSPSTGILSIYGFGDPLFVRDAQEKIDIENDVFPGSQIYGQGNKNLEFNETPTYTHAELIVPKASISNGLILSTLALGNTTIYTANSEHPPYLNLKYEEGYPKAYAQSPSGYIKPGESTTFSWRTTWSGFPIEDIQQTSATLEWKNGESGSINSVVISGNATAYTMPANTLPESQNLFWRIKTATAEGEIISNWQKFQTVDSTPEVTALSPSGTYADGTKAIRLVWSYAVETGTAQTAYDTQYKTASGDWTDLQSKSTGNAYADIPEGTLPAGNIQWRVRAYNQDGIASEWSNALTMVVISSPAAPQVRITAATPRPEIAWTSIDQQAYQVVIGSYDSGLQFGTAKSFKCPEYLADGQTRARVRIMNAYSLWSEYGSTDFEIENTTPAAAPVLSGSGGVNANLRWTGAEGASGYLVYREGKKIAEVTGDEYTDRYAIGQKSYFVRAVFPGTDFYADSNTMQIVSVSEAPVICDMDGGEWIPLRYSTTVLPATQINAQQEISLMHYSGSQYPTPEISSFRQRTYTINTAFQDMGMAYRFEALIGKKTCLKDQYQNLIIGILTSTTRMQSKLFTAYTAVINQIEE